MAGWSILKNGSGLNCPEKCQQVESSGGCSDDSNDVQQVVDDYDENLRRLFDQVFMMLLNGVHGRNNIKPIPALLGDGSSPDLFKLFCLVRERGGFESVSKEKLWGLIAEKMGLDFNSAASLKLIHSKYLNELDELLNKTTKEGALSNGSYECNGNLGLLLLELEKRFRELSFDWDDSDNRKEKASTHENEKVFKHVHMSPKESFRFPGSERGNNLHYNVAAEAFFNYDDENISMDEENLGKYGPNLVKNDDHSCKRKRDIFAGMMNWLMQAAKNPRDSSIGNLPNQADWKENGGKDLWYWALKTREAMLQRSYADLNSELCPSQKKIRMHPSMYEDHQPIEGLRSSKRLSFVKSASCPCCKSCSTNRTRLACPSKCSLDNTLEKPKPGLQPTNTDSFAVKPTTSLSVDNLPVEKRVSVGSQFQAKVPTWLGESYESDSKWLGTRIWPPDSQAQNSNIGVEVIGTGRLGSCHCRVPGSVACIRFHTAENRMRLKHELGLVFQRWGFDRMGEEVSLSWSAEDEIKFKEVMRGNPLSLGKSYFSKKTWKELVRYYFNVYLINRRGYQNRVTPKGIDSDDDESPFGSVGGAYGHEAIKASRSNLLTCTQNEQCIDLDSP